MILHSLKQGFSKVQKTKRMVFFAWVVNVAMALVLALPLLSQLNAYIRESLREDELLRKFDANWYQTWQIDMQASELTRHVDYSILGYAPFLHHTEAVLSGTVIKAVGNFFYALILRFSFTTPDLLVGLTVLYILLSTFLAAAFIGMYAKEYRLSFTEFLMEGAKYFGRFFRLSLLSLLVYSLLFLWLFDWAGDRIPVWTANSSSEMTPFIYYLVKNTLVLLVLSVVTLCFDYAKIRVVVEDRISALIALIAGTRFAINNFRETFGLYLLLTLFGLGLLVLYAVVEQQIVQQSFSGVLLAMVVGQLFMLARFWLKASFYASQTALYRQAVQSHHTV
jgi:hypothetical protein